MTHRTEERVKRDWSGVAPHIAAGVIFLTWLYFQVTLGTSGVPGPVNQSFGAISGLYFAYIMRPKNGNGK